MGTAVELFMETLEWFKDHYDEHEYWNESDVACALWDRMRRRNAELGFPFSIRSQFRPTRGNRGDIVDLAVLDPAGNVLVVIEVKYEPSPIRKGVIQKHGNCGHLLPAHKPVSVSRTDIEKVIECVDAGNARLGFAVFIDEGSLHHSHVLARQIPDGSMWHRLGRTAVKGHDVSILVYRYPITPESGPIPCDS
jgi:hypothetical protein